MNEERRKTNVRATGRACILLYLLLMVTTAFAHEYVLAEPGTYTLNYRGNAYTVNYKCDDPNATYHPQQDYRPLVEEGKVWTLESKVQFSADGFYVDTTKYEIKGDSLIGDVTYKRLLLDGKCRYLLREEGKRVYMFNNDEEFLLYDFGLGLGDVMEEKLHELGDYQVSRIFSVNASDKTLRCMELTGLAEANDVNYWIEGVGGLEGPIWPFYSTRDGAFLTLLSCEVNGEILYQYGDFTTTAISHIASPASSTLYDLQGRKIEAKPGKGIYIKDGKKYMMK